MLKSLLGELNNDVSWLKDRTIFLTRTGSHCYGTNIIGSDEDFKGIAVPPKEYFLGYKKRFEQLERKDPDLTVFNIHKIIKLAAEGNPNCLELLFVDSSDIIHIDKHGEKILSIRDEFISKACKERFLGFARAQAHRIKSHRKWILNPPKQNPTRADFGLKPKPEIPAVQMEAVKSQIAKQLARWNPDFEPFSEAQKIWLQRELAEILADMSITADNSWMSAARKLGYDDNFIYLLQKEREYEGAKENWDNFQEWKSNRNAKRYELEVKYGYDCYTDDTEFLTENGWKKYTEINQGEKLATLFVNKTKGKITNRTDFGVEYQEPTEKFEGNFTGNLYNLFGNHTDILVTPNHNMLICKEERKSGKKGEWSLVEASNLPDTFEIVRSITPNKKNYSNGNIFDNIVITQYAFMKLIGWYLTDGCAEFYESKKSGDKRPTGIRISQIQGGKLIGNMTKFANRYKDLASTSLYYYNRKPNQLNPNFHVEYILSIRNKIIVEKIVGDCGSTKNKRIPRWVYGLSKTLMSSLLDAMIDGDGTKSRPDNSMIYYSSLKPLADDFQELALMCGYETSLYGPYEQITKVGTLLMYQVHVNKMRSQFKKCIRSMNVKTIKAENQKIVCFSVANGNLITRRNGHVGFHGNSKHALHLTRLTRMCKEILETGKVLVKRPDAQELIEIRNGKWTYDQLIEYFDKIEKEIKLAYDKSTVKKLPNFAKIEQTVIEIVEEMIK
jgi:predicted nucleotidyltransferase